jgi:hypothetical protein
VVRRELKVLRGGVRRNCKFTPKGTNIGLFIVHSGAV